MRLIEDDPPSSRTMRGQRAPPVPKTEVELLPLQRLGAWGEACERATAGRHWAVKSNRGGSLLGGSDQVCVDVRATAMRNDNICG